jgi:hypothetical protein
MRMSERELEEIKKLLKRSLPATQDAELRRDLWSAMQQRLAEPSLHVRWWDWALLAAAGLLICLFPATLPALLYHL